MIPTERSPGIYHDMPADEYHALDYASNSRLTTAIRRSFRHMRHEIENPKTSPAFDIGSATHLLALEPDAFDDAVAVEPVVNRRTKDGRAELQAFAEANRGRIIITPEQERQACGMRAALAAHPTARALLGPMRTATEIVVIWDEPNGLRCKIRADFLAEMPSVVIAGDLKTTLDASLVPFSRSVYNFGYHRQGWFYLRGLAAGGVDVDEFAIIAVEKDPPHGVAVRAVQQDALDVGGSQLLPMLDLYRKCELDGIWPCYGDGLTSIGLPRWAYREAGAG